MTADRDRSGRSPGPEERRAAWLAGALDADERRAYEETILASDAEAEALYSDLALDEALDRAGSAEAGAGAARTADPAAKVVPMRPRPRRAGRIAAIAALPIAAALAFLFLRTGAGPEAPEAPPVFRGEMELLQPIGPVGDLAAPPEVFAWALDPEAASYAIEVTDDEARVIWRATSTEPRIEAPPEALAPLAGRSADWVVISRDARGFEIRRSPPVRFRMP